MVSVGGCEGVVSVGGCEDGGGVSVKGNEGAGIDGASVLEVLTSVDDVGSARWSEVRGREEETSNCWVSTGCCLDASSSVRSTESFGLRSGMACDFQCRNLRGDFSRASGDSQQGADSRPRWKLW